jgi:hypothetical protein
MSDSEVCEKLRDVQSFLFCRNKCELTVEIYQIVNLRFYKQKLKIQNKTSVEKYFKKI